MKLRFLLGALLISLGGWGEEPPHPGQRVDLAAFGTSRVWDGRPGIEWDEPRAVRQIEVEFADAHSVPQGQSLALEYWVSNWPPLPSGGWTKTDTPWQGEWRRITTATSVTGNALVFRIQPLAEAENPNARNAPGYTPSFRRTLKLRLGFTGPAVPFRALHVYGDSRWNLREINIQTGLEGHTAVPVSATAYNGFVLATSPLASQPPGSQLKVLYSEHSPDSNDRTVLQLRAGADAFGVSIDDLMQRKGIYVRPLGIFLGDGAVKEDFAVYSEAGTFRAGEDITSRVSRHAEQSLDQALAEIPRLALATRQGSHPLRYVPLGFPTSREKYGLDFNGNAFISKGSAKAMKEDLARMLWQGDQIYFRLGTGAMPDFRERELGAKQDLLDSYLPLVITRWQGEGIAYKEEAYATLLDAPLDDTHLRGDEPSIMFLRLHATNPKDKPADAQVWFVVSPREDVDWKDSLLLGTGNKEGHYAAPRLRAALDAAQGTLELRELSPAANLRSEKSGATNSEKESSISAHGAPALVWSVSLPAHGSADLDIKIPFRTMTTADDQALVRQISFDKRRDETLGYWKQVLAHGMRVHVPDEELNRFFHTTLQHILVSDERDVKTGLDMCPCGTYDYNMFANETDAQVRLLDMRGMHDWAWRCLRPIVELQGSKPFPGNFRDTSAELHGVRVDADHDYTHSGYNLNHGWTLWTMAEHYLFTRDVEWLKQVEPHMLKAADWIISERQATMKRAADGTPVPEYGLLPAGQLEDNEELLYWFAVNGYAYRGLAAAAEALSAIDPAAAVRLRKEAQAYRSDIRQAAFHAMSIAPVVPLRDGTFVPAIPSRASLHGRDFGWIRNTLYGAHTMVDCGVFDADEPVTTWILQDYEDNLFMAEDSFSTPDRDWFSRGGIALQPSLVDTSVTYLRRDQVPLALRAYFNEFAASYYPDVSAFTEWVPSFGIGGGPFFKTSDEAKSLIWLRLLLVREAGDTLYLNSGAPRAWFLPGRTIEVAGAATFFGEAGFTVESHPEDGFIAARVSPPQRSHPRQIQLRLRHPEGKPMLRVEVNGRNWTEFNAEKELISLPVDQGEVSVRAFFQ
jgi:hypothetical protein